MERNALEGPTRLLELARICARVNEPELALDLLEVLVTTPYDGST